MLCGPSEPSLLLLGCQSRTPAKASAHIPVLATAATSAWKSRRPQKTQLSSCPGVRRMTDRERRTTAQFQPAARNLLGAVHSFHLEFSSLHAAACYAAFRGRRPCLSSTPNSFAILSNVEIQIDPEVSRGFCWHHAANAVPPALWLCTLVGQRPSVSSFSCHISRGLGWESRWIRGESAGSKVQPGCCPLCRSCIVGDHHDRATVAV